jgi:3-oxoacyl-[acyl-carrier-protein] synthase-3
MSQQNRTSRAAITGIEYYLPETVVTNAELASEFPEWQIEKLAEKTGIQQRHIASPGECSSDLAVSAAHKLFGSGHVSPGDIDVVMLCTQTPDYFLPTTACMLQHRLGIPTSVAALDFNLGCSGFVYGIGLAKGLIETGQARRVLFLTAETYSKFLNPCDRNVRVLFGDGAAATLIESVPAGSEDFFIEPPVWGTDGHGAPNLIVPAGAARSFASASSDGNPPSEAGDGPTARRLFMNGPEVFNFTVQRVPQMVQEVLRRHGKGTDDIDLFVFHQASKMLLDHLRRKLEIPAERFCTAIEDCGNTVSSTIPIALKRASIAGMLKPGDSVLLAGFGVGYSWAGTIIRWPEFRAVNSGRALASVDSWREQGGLKN